jgi:RNA polymerase sigma-70 factor (ECF subfamily)
MTSIDPALSDIELLRQMRGGTAAAFQLLYRRHHGALFRFATMRSGSRDTAADVVQEVFMALLAGSIVFDPLRGVLPNFLFGVARNVLMKLEAPRWRDAALSEEEQDALLEVADEGGEPLERMLGNELAEEIRRALAQLAPHYRDALILYELHDMSYLEIADICQVDIGTVRSRLARGRAALAKRLYRQRPERIDAA